MTDARDPEADDAFLDRLLDEEVGGRRSPDFVERVVRAPAFARSDAAARVDAATAVAADDTGELFQLRRLLPWTIVAAVLALAVAWSVSDGAVRRPPQSPADRALALLDAFHRVMPTEPSALRDPARRRRFAPDAIPVLREMTRLLAANPGSVTWVARADEFTVLSLVLDEPEATARIGAAVRAGDPAADVLAAAAAAITAADERARGEALDRVAAHLREPSDAARCAVQCLMTAGDLSADEAQRLAAATTAPDLAQRLRIGAALAADDPRRLVGRPFELVGNLLNGAEFSTASLRGKVVMVFFWASWCAPCTRVLPEIAAVARRHEREGLAVVGVSCDHDRGELERFLAAHSEVTWPQLFEPGQPGWHPLAVWAGVRAVPRVFLVDRRGVLREIHTRDDLDGLVRKLLEE